MKEIFKGIGIAILVLVALVFLLVAVTACSENAASVYHAGDQKTYFCPDGSERMIGSGDGAIKYMSIESCHFSNDCLITPADVAFAHEYEARCEKL